MSDPGLSTSILYQFPQAQCCGLLPFFLRVIILVVEDGHKHACSARSDTSVVPPMFGKHRYDFNLTWVMFNPDNIALRKVIGVNGAWPLPDIEVDKGDQLLVNVLNSLDRDVSMHFHGMFQNGTNCMDGPNMVTQCPISLGGSYVYNATVNQNGTRWYHCHTDFCYPDGYRQALIVHGKDAFFNDMNDEEFITILSDRYHEMVEDIAPSFLSLYNPTGAEPIPDSFLFNDTLNTKIPVDASKTYMFRLIKSGAFTAHYFIFRTIHLRSSRLMAYIPNQWNLKLSTSQPHIGIVF